MDLRKFFGKGFGVFAIAGCLVVGVFLARILDVGMEWARESSPEVVELPFLLLLVIVVARLLMWALGWDDKSYRVVLPLGWMLLLVALNAVLGGLLAALMIYLPPSEASGSFNKTWGILSTAFFVGGIIIRSIDRSRAARKLNE